MVLQNPSVRIPFDNLRAAWRGADDYRTNCNKAPKATDGQNGSRLSLPIAVAVARYRDGLRLT